MLQFKNKTTHTKSGALLMFRKKPLVSAIGAASVLASAVSVPVYAQNEQVLEEVDVTGHDEFFVIHDL